MLVTDEKLACDALPHFATPVEELPPQRHTLKSTAERAGGLEIRRGKQAPIRFEVVQPRSADDARRLPRRALDVLEERREILAPLPPSLEGQWRNAIALNILEVETNALRAQGRVAETAECRHDFRRERQPRSAHVEAICPLAAVRRVAQTGNVLLPDRMGWIEVAAQSESNVEVGVLEKGLGQCPPRKNRNRLGELELKIEERARVDHRNVAISLVLCLQDHHDDLRPGGKPDTQEVAVHPPAGASRLAAAVSKLARSADRNGLRARHAYA